MSGVCELSGVDDLLAIGDFGRNNGSFGGYGKGRSQQAEGSGIMEEVSLWYDALTLDPSGVVVVRDQEAPPHDYLEYIQLSQTHLENFGRRNHRLA